MFPHGRHRSRTLFWVLVPPFIDPSPPLLLLHVAASRPRRRVCNSFAGSWGRTLLARTAPPSRASPTKPRRMLTLRTRRSIVSCPRAGTSCQASRISAERVCLVTCVLHMHPYREKKHDRDRGLVNLPRSTPPCVVFLGGNGGLRRGSKRRHSLDGTACLDVCRKKRADRTCDLRIMCIFLLVPRTQSPPLGVVLVRSVARQSKVYDAVFS